MKLLLEHVNCDFCGGEKYFVRYRKPDNWLWINQYEFPVVECVNCKLVYINPRPTQESMALYYPIDYHENRNSDEFLARYRIQTEYLPKLTKEKILDIGCARGDYLNFLKQLYPEIEATGVDYFSDKVDFDFIKFHNETLPDANLNSNYFDLVMAWAVFEHLHNPSVYFQEVSRILKAEGKFVFLVTNSESLYGRMAFKEDVPRHTYHFSEHTLKNYADKYDFKFKDCAYETRLWDPTGKDTFYYMFMKILGVTWDRIYLRRINRIQKYVGKAGKFLDKIIFKSSWEARKRRSGIIIITFEKN